MIATVTRQDLQGALEYAKNRILERQLTRQEAQNFMEVLRTSLSHQIHELHYENQTLLKVCTRQTEQILHRIDSIEARLANMDQSPRR